MIRNKKRINFIKHLEFFSQCLCHLLNCYLSLKFKKLTFVKAIILQCRLPCIVFLRFLVKVGTHDSGLLAKSS